MDWDWILSGGKLEWVTLSVDSVIVRGHVD
jgi:hypothetical protein